MVLKGAVCQPKAPNFCCCRPCSNAAHGTGPHRRTHDSTTQTGQMTRTQPTNKAQTKPQRGNQHELSCQSVLLPSWCWPYMSCAGCCCLHLPAWGSRQIPIPMFACWKAQTFMSEGLQFSCLKAACNSCGGSGLRLGGLWAGLQRMKG